MILLVTFSFATLCWSPGGSPLGILLGYGGWTTAHCYVGTVSCRPPQPPSGADAHTTHCPPRVGLPLHLMGWGAEMARSPLQLPYPRLLLSAPPAANFQMADIYCSPAKYIGMWLPCLCAVGVVGLKEDPRTQSLCCSRDPLPPLRPAAESMLVATFPEARGFLELSSCSLVPVNFLPTC